MLKFFVLFVFLEIFQTVISADNSKIGKRIEAPSGEFPSQVDVAVIKAKNSHEHLCSGTIIEDGHIVTTAGCLAKYAAKDLIIIAGSSENTQTINVELIARHPDYDKATDSFDYNIAILKLKKRLTRTAFVNPAVVAKFRPENGAKCFVAGWADIKDSSENVTRVKRKSSKFKTLDSSAVISAQFSLFYARVFAMKFELCRKCVENALCAGNTEITGNCIEDKGSPLMCNGVFHGVYVGSAKKCQILSGVYTDIVYYKNWIDNIIEWNGLGEMPMPHAATRRYFTDMAAPIARSVRKLPNLICMIIVVIFMIW